MDMSFCTAVNTEVLFLQREEEGTNFVNLSNISLNLCTT